MAEITWKNVNSLTDMSGYNQMLGNLQRNLTALGNVATNYIDQRRLDEIKAHEKLTQMNTDAIINQMQQVNNTADLAKAKATGVYDLARLQALSGGAIDGKAFNTAYGNWDKNVLEQEQTADRALDYNPETKQLLSEYYRAVQSGDTAKAQAIASRINGSMATMRDIGERTYDVVNKERQYNQQERKYALETGEFALKTKQAITDTDTKLAAKEKELKQAYQAALINNPDLKKEEFLAADPEYQALLSQRTALSASLANAEAVTNQYNAGTGSGITNSNPYTPQWNNFEEMRQGFIAEGAKYGLSPEIVTGVIGSESGWQTNAKNPLSSASGLGQVVTDTWNDYAGKLGLPKVTKDIEGTDKDPRFNPTYAKQVSMAVASDSYYKTKDAAQAAGEKNDVVIVKMGYFFGHNGANRYWKQMAKAPDTKAEDFFSADVLKSNPFLKGKTLADVRDYFDKKTQDAIQTSNNATQAQQAETAKNAIDSAIQQQSNNPDGSNTTVAQQVIEKGNQASEKAQEQQPEISILDADGNLDLNKLESAYDKWAKQNKLKRANALSQKNPDIYNNRSLSSEEVYNGIFNDLNHNPDHPSKWGKPTNAFVEALGIPPSHPNSVRYYLAMAKQMSEWNTEIDNIKEEEDAAVLQQFLGSGKIGGLTRESFNVPKQLKINTKAGQVTVTDSMLRSTFFNPDSKPKSDKEIYTAIDALFQQKGGYDQITVRDNIKHAIIATQNPMLILKLYQDSVLDTYRAETKKDDAKEIPKGYVPDMDFNPFNSDGTDFGNQFLDRIDALRALDRDNLESMQNLFKLNEERDQNRRSGTAKMAYFQHVRDNIYFNDEGYARVNTNPRKFLESQQAITRTELTPEEKKIQQEQAKMGREILDSLPDINQNAVDNIPKYAPARVQKKQELEQHKKGIELTSEQLKQLKTYLQNSAGNSPEAEKIKKRLIEYGGKIKIKNK
nr:MAG: putative endolysin [Enquatrovirus sp.]